MSASPLLIGPICTPTFQPPPLKYLETVSRVRRTVCHFLVLGDFSPDANGHRIPVALIASSAMAMASTAARPLWRGVDNVTHSFLSGSGNGDATRALPG